MKCMDCLPLLEEFFDGEVDEKTGEQMRAHLASCAECSEALDGLRAEQEVFLRYEREVEVTPALWHGVRERIAAERPEPRPPFLLRLREQLAAAVAVFPLRPALASSLALLVVGVAAASIWFARPTARVNPVEIAGVNPDATNGAEPAPTVERAAPPAPSPSEDGGKALTAATSEGTDGSRLNAPKYVAAGGVRTSLKVAPRGAGEIVDINDTHHTPDEPPLAVRADRFDAIELADAAAELDPGDEAVERHVERAQVLLRSFKNARAAEGDGDIAYEKELSRKLLDENISLRLEAEVSGNKNAKRVLSSLEPFLLDISNLREQPSRGDVRSIRERMEKQEIIAALHVYDD